jgi:hypothetical protein
MSLFDYYRGSRARPLMLIVSQLALPCEAVNNEIFDSEHPRR